MYTSYSWGWKISPGVENFFPLPTSVAMGLKEWVGRGLLFAALKHHVSENKEENIYAH